MSNDQESEFDPKKNLIVNYLPLSFSQDDVRQIFSPIGPVSNCKLVRNNVTGQSLGYAFIRYPTEEVAAQAITQVNGMQIEGKIIRVNFARQSTPEIQNSNVYIAGMPAWVTEEKLLSMFNSFGNVISHKLLTNPDGTSRGAGFVRYSLNSEATAAISEMGGKVLPETNGPLTVKLAIPPTSKQDSLQALGTITTNTITGIGLQNYPKIRFSPLPAAQIHTPQTAVALALSECGGVTGQNPKASVYVFGLQETSTDLTLYELFSPFGGIINVKLIRDLGKEGQPCKGYGFVNYVKSEDAVKAVKSMNGVTYEERILQVSHKQNKSLENGNQPRNNGQVVHDRNLYQQGSQYVTGYIH